MTTQQIEVRAISELYDVQARRIAREILQLPMQHVSSLSAIATSPQPLSIRTAHLYNLSGTLTPSQIDQLTQQLLVDPVVGARLIAPASSPHTNHIVDVFLHPGVTDTLAESVLTGARMLGITGLEQVQTGQRYILDPRLSREDVHTITKALLYNPVIQQYILHDENTVRAQFFLPTDNELRSSDAQSVGKEVFIAPL